MTILIITVMKQESLVRNSKVDIRGFRKYKNIKAHHMDTIVQLTSNERSSAFLGHPIFKWILTKIET